jgi:hypothetical protein
VEPDREGDGEEVGGDERVHGAFPAAEAAGGAGREQQHGGQWDGDGVGHAEVAQGQGDADQLGDQGERVEQQQVGDGERAPEAAEAGQDEAGVADAGDRAEAADHFLVDQQDG